MQKLMMVQDEKWFEACGCQSIKIMYIKDYFQNFRAIHQELSEYLHFEDWQGIDVCLCYWKSHMKNKKCRIAPDLVYEK